MEHFKCLSTNFISILWHIAQPLKERSIHTSAGTMGVNLQNIILNERSHSQGTYIFK
jgi:hypothetical protein